jgi:hypothetical protein
MTNFESVGRPSSAVKEIYENPSERASLIRKAEAEKK